MHDANMAAGGFRMAVVQHAISKAEVDQLFAGLQNALPHHFDNGAAAVAATVFRCSRRLRPLERHLRDLPKREPALPERWVTGLANYGIDRRSARRKCAGTTWGRPCAIGPVKISGRRLL